VPAERACVFNQAAAMPAAISRSRFATEEVRVRRQPTRWRITGRCTRQLPIHPMWRPPAQTIKQPGTAASRPSRARLRQSRTWRPMFPLPHSGPDEQPKKSPPRGGLVFVRFFADLSPLESKISLCRCRVYRQFDSCCCNHWSCCRSRFPPERSASPIAT